MDILIYYLEVLLVFLVIILGIIGCFVPVIPGPPIAYIGLLIFHFFTSCEIETYLLWILGIIVVVVTVSDYWLQIYGVKKFGGTQKAVNGSIIGLILGIFLPIGPIGLIIGPFLGAFIGSQMEKDAGLGKSLKIALGALTGFILGTLLKLSVSLYIAFVVLKNLC